jgi:hypothetical protein
MYGASAVARSCPSVPEPVLATCIPSHTPRGLHADLAELAAGQLNPCPPLRFIASAALCPMPSSTRLPRGPHLIRLPSKGAPKARTSSSADHACAVNMHILSPCACTRSARVTRIRTRMHAVCTHMQPALPPVQRQMGAAAGRSPIARSDGSSQQSHLHVLRADAQPSMRPPCPPTFRRLAEGGADGLHAAG